MTGVFQHIAMALCFIGLGFLLGVIWHQGIAAAREDDLFKQMERRHARIRLLETEFESGTK